MAAEQMEVRGKSEVDEDRNDATPVRCAGAESIRRMTGK